MSRESQALCCRPEALGTCSFHTPVGRSSLFRIMGIALPLSHVGPLEAVVAGLRLAILVRDVARPARSVSSATSDDSSQTIVCHVGLFRAVVTSEGTPAYSRGVKDIL